MRLIVPLLLCSAIAAQLHAKEGMWVPQQLPEIAGPLKAAGLELSPKQLADLTGDPMGAVVALGGCTASFVSPDGLVATNHHCAYGAIQLNSTAQRNLMNDGFVAMQRGEELSAGPAARVFVMDKITEVTDQIKAAAASAADGLARQNAIEAAQKKLLAECESEPGYRCTLYGFFGGLQYRLFRQIEITDVRLVYAPPGSIGNYGGEIDNWMWPRHTGDFSFYRAYVGKDGKPAPYSTENVPFKPKHWLKLADKPLRAGDFVMVAGYPGSTQRFALADEFDQVANWQYPVVGGYLKELVALIESTGKQDADLAVKYAAQIRGFQNTMKNWDGQLEGFKRINAPARKKEEEKATLAWLQTKGEAGKPALDAYQTLQKINEQARVTRERDLYLGQIGNQGLFGQIRQLHRLAVERVKPNAERAPGFQDRDLPRIESGIQQLERRFDARMEKPMMAYFLNLYAKLPADQRVKVLDALIGDGSSKAINAGLDKLYANTTLVPVEQRMALMKADLAAFEASTDPLVVLARELHPTYMALENKTKTIAGDNAKYRPIYLQAMIDYRKSQNRFVYPDANLSLRITFGNVTGYVPRDGVDYTPFTTLGGLAAKATGSEPFAAPKNQLDAIAAKKFAGREDSALGTVPVNFLSDLDITGGNSGSPVLDARGKLVGLAFDGNWESVSSNWVYDPVMTRMISVDARYMLWIMENIFPAPHLVKEMTAK